MNYFSPLLILRDKLFDYYYDMKYYTIDRLEDTKHSGWLLAILGAYIQLTLWLLANENLNFWALNAYRNEVISLCMLLIHVGYVASHLRLSYVDVTPDDFERLKIALPMTVETNK